MCGIAGICNVNSTSHDQLRADLVSMSQAIKHRGPDDCGTFIDESNHVGLSHNRLSIIELSSLGHQPMRSSNGRFVITFNGEIYNHVHLRLELNSITNESINWCGTCDTESLLEAINVWGVETTLKNVEVCLLF